MKVFQIVRDKGKRRTRINDSITRPLNIDKFTNRYLEENQKYYKQYSKFHKINKSANHFNLDTLNLMKEAGMSEIDIASFVGRPSFNPIGLTDGTKQKLLDSTNSVAEYVDLLQIIDEIDRNFSNLPILVDPDNYKQQKEDLKELRDELRENFVTGGLVSGPEVSDTKEDPADRVDPFTGEPYKAQMEELGL